jgi:hypothetical protein
MAALPPIRSPGRFLRYQFDSAAQLRRHCRPMEGHVLLFFPDESPALVPGSRGLIELCFSTSGQQVSLPAVVNSREANRVSGIWLELRALSVIASLPSAIASPRRQQRRLALDELGWVAHDGGPVVACPVLDMSKGGARVWGILGGAPIAGDKVRVRLPRAPTLGGRIAWARGREVGIAFSRQSLTPAAEIYARAEKVWAGARFARHNSACRCTTSGETLDPPTPVRTLPRGMQ